MTSRYRSAFAVASGFSVSNRTHEAPAGKTVPARMSDRHADATNSREAAQNTMTEAHRG